MAQRMAFPERLRRQDNGAVPVSFPDIPEPLAEDASKNETLGEAQVCLSLAGNIGSQGSSSSVGSTFSKANETAPTTSRQGGWMSSCQLSRFSLSAALGCTAMASASPAPRKT